MCLKIDKLIWLGFVPDELAAFNDLGRIGTARNRQIAVAPMRSLMEVATPASPHALASPRSPK